MRKNIIERTLLFCVFVFCFTASVFADPTIDVQITNRSFSGNEVSGTLTFDVEIKAGSGYRLNGAEDGEWTAMNLRIDIFGEGDIVYDVPKDPTMTTHDFPSSHQISTLTYADYPYAAIYGVYNTVSIQAGRNDMISTTDLGDTYTRIATISIPVTGGVPTEATLLKIRTVRDYDLIRSAIWANSAGIGIRRTFNHELSSTLAATASMITASPVSIESGETAMLTATASGMTTPIFRWYSSRTSATALYTGPTYTSPVLTENTTYYVTVEDADYSENEPDERKAVEVTVLTPTVTPAASVTIFPNLATLIAGSSLQLTATVLPENATDKSLTWTSIDEVVATVDSDGKVTAHTVGTATIIATTNDGGKTATATIMVYEIDIESITLDKTSETIYIGDVFQLEATINPVYATKKTVTWTSDNTEVATVDETGAVTGVSEGVAVITATAENGMTASCTVNVSLRLNRVSVHVPLKNISQYITVRFDIPVGIKASGWFALTLPAGLEVDVEGVTITESLPEGLTVKVVRIENNLWMFEVSAPQVVTTSMTLRSEERINRLRNITFTISGQLADEYEIVNRDDSELNQSDENDLNFEMVLKADETANELITKEVKVYVASGILTVDTPDAETVKMYNSTGALVFTVNKQAGKMTYPVSGLANGIYFVTGSNGWNVKALKR